MNNEEKFQLITRNLQEIISESELKELLNKKQNPSVYWGTMPTGSPHISYYFPLLKLGDFLKAGLKVKVLIADLHAALDGVPWEVLEKRERYYTELIKEMLKSIDVPLAKLEFVKGSTFQLKPKYFEDVLKMSMIVSTRDTTKAASEVVKMTENPKLGNLIYPIMQALDEVYLETDIQFGGLDQRKIFVFAREFLPKIGHAPRVELMNPMIAGLVGEKMSSSVEGSKIDMLDDEKTIDKKINKANCIEGDPNNGLMGFLKLVIFVLKEDKKQKLTISRPGKFGGNISYSSYEQLEKNFIEKKLHPMDLKAALAKELNLLLKPIRENEKLKKFHKDAYLN
ncbi:tyrosine--tRNA ligase [Candidatus Pacearchaeota archaeon]|nr:tyrosine--tRNA ligase [Candidatus Pacearchaeota archaeon]